ncbi:MAG: Holliday junction resolvase-like protein [Nanoarchaeota archaeon]|nr:Holliday junction resolvase-like protein [Nanoarchaeota archaeon]
MDLLAGFGILLIFLVFVLLMLLIIKNKEIRVLKELHKDLMFAHKSKIVKHGKSFEQLFPFMSSYPYDSNNFRFLGSPIDGISFEDDEIVFVEFKTGESQLSKKQKHIRNLVNDKKIIWKEIRDK